MALSQLEALAYAPVHVWSENLRARAFTVSALVDLYLQRIRNRDQNLHAFVETYDSDARAAAELADRAFAAGHCRGPLHGIPIAYKDLLHIEGRATGGGSLRRDVSSTSAAVVERLTAAGMIALGKTNMVELAFGSWGTNVNTGTPRNPWDWGTHRVPGGSSSGSGVAVASGLVPAAIGSDTGGSIRIPASLCGIVGLKTTVGRVSNHGVLMLSDTLDTLGPMTRDVEDAALLFNAMHGPDYRDPETLAHAPVDVLSGLKRGVHGLRLAVLPPDELGEVEPEIARAFAESLRIFRELGAQVDTLTLPSDYGTLAEATGKVIAAEGYQRHKARIDGNDPPIDPNVRRRLLAGKTLSAAEYVSIMSLRRRLRHNVDLLLRDFDALVSPTTPLVAIPVSQADERLAPMSRLTRAINLLDLCALAIPCGRTEQGLPISLQIAGRSYEEGAVLRIGWAFQNATDWHKRIPQLPPTLIPLKNFK